VSGELGVCAGEGDAAAGVAGASEIVLFGVATAPPTFLTSKSDNSSDLSSLEQGTKLTMHVYCNNRLWRASASSSSCVHMRSACHRRDTAALAPARVPLDGTRGAVVVDSID